MYKNTVKGRLGEKLARYILIEKNYKILNMNYHNRIGEIDIIARDGNILVFVEVKSRNNLNYGLPRNSVNNEKQRRIIRTSKLYLSENNLNNIQCRYDVIEVYLDIKKYNHIVNAFDLGSENSVF